jgi:hypothetical protein
VSAIASVELPQRRPKRKDARVALVRVALPHELNAAQRRDLVQAFAQDTTDRGAIDVAFTDRTASDTPVTTRTCWRRGAS